MAESLTHFDERGASRMVDVSAKPVTLRTAIAGGRITMTAETLRLILDKRVAKGDVFEVARLAGIMAAKKTGDLIPLCHPLGLSAVTLDFEPISPTEVEVRAECTVEARTGVEMEALTSVSVACLTIYDMCKAVDREMTIGPIRLLEKTGGRSGKFVSRQHAAVLGAGEAASTDIPNKRQHAAG